MKPKYLYIDDESPESLQSIINGFKDVGEIEVELVDLKKIRTFEDLKIHIQDQKPDGLIIDLRLDGEGENRLNFLATTFAQDIRTLAASGEMTSFPLILCSTNTNMRSTYNVDKSSHDLFDYKFEKSSTPNWKKFSIKLKDLSESYKWLNETERSLDDVLNRKDWQNFDNRIFEEFLDEEDVSTTNDIAQLIIKELFHHPSILIKERTVAARLGVDIEASGDEWSKLKEQFLRDCKYEGVFGNGWERWWHDKINSKFQTISEGKKLQNLNAQQRIDFLIVSGYNVKAAKPLAPYCKSTEFWTVCEYYKRPLDPLEGFKIYESVELKPWQEPKYISFSAELDRKGRDKGIRPRPSELQSVKDLKEMLS